MPVVLALEDVDHVAHGDLLLVTLVGYHADAGCDHQHLVALVSVPAGGAALLKVDDAAVESLAGACG